MFPDIHDLQAFYKTPSGQSVYDVILSHLRSFWPDIYLPENLPMCDRTRLVPSTSLCQAGICAGMQCSVDKKGQRQSEPSGNQSPLRVLGGGYASPYLCLSNLTLSARNSTHVAFFARHGEQRWPDNGLNRACLVNETELPFETNSVDRILLIHALEFTGLEEHAFGEFWRILKSHGRILIVVPNRMGWWARAEWSPFGQGRPYSIGQIEAFLRETLFIPVRNRKGLFLPPLKTAAFSRFSKILESVGARLCPAMGGLLFVEASKQLYGATLVGRAYEGASGRLKEKALRPATSAPVSSSASEQN